MFRIAALPNSAQDSKKRCSLLESQALANGHDHLLLAKVSHMCRRVSSERFILDSDRIVAILRTMGNISLYVPSPARGTHFIDSSLSSGSCATVIISVGEGICPALLTAVREGSPEILASYILDVDIEELLDPVCKAEGGSSEALVVVEQIQDVWRAF